MNSKTLMIATCLAVSAGSTISARADDAKAEGRRAAVADRRPDPGPGRGFPGFESLTPEEREKLHAAQQKAMQSDSVRIAEAAMRDAMKALRDAQDAAILTADPSLEPVVKKVKEAREKEMEAIRQRGEADLARRGGGERPAVREGDQPKRGGGERPAAREGDQPKRGEGGERPATREGDQRKRGEGDRPAAREGDQPKRGEGGERPAAREGDQPKRGEGDRPKPDQPRN